MSELDPYITVIGAVAIVIIALGWIVQVLRKPSKGSAGKAEKWVVATLLGLCCLVVYAMVTTTNPDIYRVLYGAEMPKTED